MVKLKFKKLSVIIAGMVIFLTMFSIVMYFAVKTHIEIKRAVISKTQKELLTTAKSVSDGIYHNGLLKDTVDV